MLILGLNHITLQVSDLDKSEAFYCDLLGLERVGERAGMRFYSSGRHNHELALVKAMVPNNKQVGISGLMHFSFNVTNEEALKELQQQMLENDYPHSPFISHTIAISFYCRDPDGYLIELTCDQDREKWQHQSDAFAHDYLIHTLSR